MDNIVDIYNKSDIYKTTFTSFGLKPKLIEGNFDADLAIILNTADLELLSTENMDFLWKILGAVQYNHANTLIINDKSEIKFHQIIRETKVSKMICFGSTRKAIGLNLQLKRYQLYRLESVDCLFVDSIENLKDKQQRKAALWALMKQMFKLG